MSRQAYSEVLTYVDPVSGALHPAGSAEVYVYKAGTGNLATIYDEREGGSPASNPFVTPENGLALFWGSTGDYDIKFHDTDLPARFGDYVIGWQSAPVNVEIDAGELSNNGDVTWTQEGNGAWVPQLKSGVVGLSELSNSAFIPGTRLTTGTQQQLFESGDLKASAAPAAPTGWLLCNGAEVSRTEYAALFAKIGVNCGPGNGSTTFNLPDLRGRAPIGVDGGAGRVTSNNALGQSGGAQTHTLSISQIPVHAHYVNINSNASGDHVHGMNVAFSYGGGGGGAITGQGTNRNTEWGGNHAHNSQGWSNNEGGGGSHNNLQPYQVVNWFIKT